MKKTLKAAGAVVAMAGAAAGGHVYGDRVVPGPETWRGLVVEEERDCSEYDGREYAYTEALEGRIQEEIGQSPDGGWYGQYEARTFRSEESQIEHVVARHEAHLSGMCGRTAAEKAAFANDLNNIALAGGVLNREKSDRDAGTWAPPHGRCWYARTVVFVKQTHRLSVDPRERDGLERMIGECVASRVPV